MRGVPTDAEAWGDKQPRMGNSSSINATQTDRPPDEIFQVFSRHRQREQHPSVQCCLEGGCHSRRALADQGGQRRKFLLHGRGAVFDVCDAVVARRNANQAVKFTSPIMLVTLLALVALARRACVAPRSSCPHAPTVASASSSSAEHTSRAPWRMVGWWNAKETA